MAKTKLAFKVPESQLETEPMTRERAVAGERYGLTFRMGSEVLPCIMVFVGQDGQVLEAGMDSRGLVAPIGAKLVEAYRWQRK